MRKAKVITNYENEPDEELDDLVQEVVPAMIGNVQLPISAPKAAAVQVNMNLFHTSRLSAKAGIPGASAQKEAARKLITDGLNDLAVAVNEEANGDLVKLESSSLPLEKEAVEGYVFPAPVGTKIVILLVPGEVDFETKPLRGAKGVVFRHCSDVTITAGSHWDEKFFSHRKFRATGLASGQYRWVKFAFQGTTDELEFSDPVRIIVF